jgi:hypothetical protein
LAFGGFVVSVLSSSAAALPQADFPVEMKRSLPVRSDVALTALLDIVRESAGKVITSDKSSGLLVCKLVTPLSPKGVYFNVLIKPAQNNSQTTVYVWPRHRNRAALGGEDAHLFEKLSQKLRLSQPK